MGHSSESVPDCNWLRSDCSTLNRLSMPWRVLTLLFLASILPGVHNFRVKRQYGSPSYHLQQWGFDQVSYQQPYGYRDQANYGHNPSYHNYYQQREINPHQAPSGWNLNTYNYAGYNYPYNGYYTQQRSGYSGYATPPQDSQQRSGYATPPPANPSGSSYGRPPIIRDQEIIYTHNNGRVPSEQRDEYPTAPAGWENGARGGDVGMRPAAEVTTTQGSVVPPNVDQAPSTTFLARQPTDRIENPDKHGIEVTKENSEEAFIKSAVEEDIDSTINTKLSPGQSPAQELPAEFPSTTLSSIDEKLKSVTGDMTTSDIIDDIMATTPSPDGVSTGTESSAPLFVDADESSPSWTPAYPDFTQETAATENRPSNGPNPQFSENTAAAGNQPPDAPSPPEFTQNTPAAGNQPQDGQTLPLDEFLPTEVPAATTAEPETDMEATAPVESSSSANDGVILRSPPLPKQVADTLKELGISILKMF